MQALVREVGELLEAALAVEPAGGLTEGWQELLGRLGVNPVAEDVRFDQARDDGLFRGAPLDEVRACLARLVSSHGARLGDSNPDVARGLSHLAGSALGRYRELASEKPKGMFGFARKTAEQHQYAKYKAQSLVHGCGTCGAPRFRDDLACDFCGGKTGDVR